MITEQEFINYITKGTLTLDICKEWVESGGDVDIQNENGYTALMWASSMGHLEIVQYLVEKGAKLDIQNDWGYTALMVASRNGHLDIIKYLVENKVDINHQNKYGETSIMLAAWNDYLKVVEYLIESGVNIFIKSINHANCLLYANSKELILYLINKGLSINECDLDGNNLLIELSRDQNIDLLKFIIELEVDLFHKNIDNNNVLFYLINNNKGIKLILQSKQYTTKIKQLKRKNISFNKFINI